MELLESELELVLEPEGQERRQQLRQEATVLVQQIDEVLQLNAPDTPRVEPDVVLLPDS